MRRPRENDIEKRKNASKMRRPYENDVEKSKMRPKCDDLMKRTSKIVKMSKFVKILIDALVVILGI